MGSSCGIFSSSNQFQIIIIQNSLSTKEITLLCIPTHQNKEESEMSVFLCLTTSLSISLYFLSFSPSIVLSYIILHSRLFFLHYLNSHIPLLSISLDAENCSSRELVLRNPIRCSYYHVPLPLLRSAGGKT